MPRMKSGKPVRIGVLGLTHDHVWYNLKELKSVRDAALVAAADPNEPLLEQFRQEHKRPAYADPEEMLARERVDAVFVFGDNAGGAELAELAAEHGLHVMIEKPLAANLEGADHLLAAARNHRARVMVSWPFAWWPPLQAALALAANGKIGRVWQVKYRSAHAGPREMGCSKYFYDWLYDEDLNGAGAFIDYCCYGAALARAVLGMPSRVTGIAGRFCKEDIVVDDNGVLIMTYPNALAIAEASWTQIGHLSSYVTWLYGTEGTLMVEPGDQGKLVLATAKEPNGKQVKVSRLPAHMRHASAHFVHCLRTGEDFTPLCNDRIGRDAQEILEAGLISAEEGADVSLPLNCG
jgi:predicted dehydrogenase